MLHIRLLGNFSLSDAQERPVKLGESEQLLLAYLLLKPESHLRTQVAGNLWREANQTKANNNFRQALLKLRKVLDPYALVEDSFLIVDQQKIQWNKSAPCWVDVREFDLLIRQSIREQGTSRIEKLKKATAIYTDDLLLSVQKDEWCQEERSFYLRKYSEALQELVQELIEAKEYALAIPYARQILTKHKADEKAHVYLMRLHNFLGDKHAAVEQYFECKRRLNEIYQCEPSKETKELYRSIITGTALDRLEKMETQARAKKDEHDLPSTPFIGRNKELEKLLDAWHEAQDGRGQARFITGRAGVGKTSLVRQINLFVGKKQGLILSGRCFDQEKMNPLHPLIQALRESLPKIAPKTLRAIPSLWLSELLKLLPELAEKFPKIKAEKTPTLSPEQERNRRFESLSQVLIGITRQQPLLLFLDDLQWADESTLEFMHYLIRRLAHQKILLIGTYRTEAVSETHPLRPLLQQSLRDKLHEEIVLAPFARAESDQLLQEMVPSPRISKLTEWVYSKTQGLPLYTTLLMEILVKSAALKQDEQGSWSFDEQQLARISLTESMEARSLVEPRLRPLSERAREMLDLASVIGRPFSLDFLAQLTHQSIEAWFEPLKELLAAFLVTESQDEISFDHDVSREVVYALLRPLQKRKSWHKRIGETLEARADLDRDSIAGTLASHFLQAGVWPKALEYSLRAGEVARKAYANQAGISHFLHVLELAERLKDKEALRTTYANLGHLSVIVGKLDEGIEYCRKALDLTSDVHARARIYETMATAHNYKLEHEKALKYCETGIQELGESDDSIEKAKLFDNAAMLLCAFRRFEDALQYCTTSLQITERIEKCSIIAAIYSHMGQVFLMQGYIDKAIENNMEALKAAERSNDLNTMAEAFYNIGRTYSIKRDAVKALDFLAKASLAYEKLGDMTSLVWTFQLMCWVSIQNLDICQAVVFAHEALELATQTSQVREIAYSHGYLGCLSLHQGAELDANYHFKHAQEMASNDGVLYIGIAITFTLLQDFDKAFEWVEKGFPYLTNEHRKQMETSVYLEPLRNQQKFKKFSDTME